MRTKSGITAEIAAQLIHLDDAVEEVFRLMMGLSCTPFPGPTVRSNEVSAIIGLAGTLTGVFIIDVTREGAMCIAGALMNMSVTIVDEMVKDSVGELCNMLAGGWKGRFPSLAAKCVLSVPMIATGKDYTLHAQNLLTRLGRSYRFQEHSMIVSIWCEATE
jgi:chemotaxis protein CheX